MKTPILSLLLCLATQLTVAPFPATAAEPDSETSIKILLVTGGCCHDYDFQTKSMQLAFKARGIAANWTVVNDGGNGTDAEIELYQNPQWSAGFDVVIHNECFAATTNPDYIRSITKSHHAGTNAVVIHCAMHTYRDAKIDDWREFLGVTSRRHEHQSHYAVDVVAAEHAIMKGFPAGYKTAMDELYVIEKTWPNTTVLATSKSEKSDQAHPVFWTNQYGKARVFGTTYGHSNETFEDAVYLDTIVKGTLWAAGKM
ncbi:Trehalose utilization [Novipirellula galeiformis]|uniref:Trehalose utilization n=1 Tax=Novipirellula galeiformis TaxID=2528004 RepID=A0A5C6CS06_9BACT|nr:ThuA domain-containing protein [Novipirellula galeiformis]TWU26655.1 Trehalose utilization [Novipirellula galeiformis]